MYLNEYKKDIYSQGGEDGVIEEILKKINLNIPNNECWCCEFGAWDGKFGSNTFALVEKGWNAIYIEPDDTKFSQLKKTADSFKNITAIKSYIKKNHKDDQSLDNVLLKTDIPKDFEILSIDIDSYDLDVWESLENYTPKIVIIEVDGRIPPGIILRHSDKVIGNSFSATLQVGKKKGYLPICYTGNLIFIRNDYANLIPLNDKYIEFPELLFEHTSLKNKIFQDRDPFMWLTLITPPFLFPIMRFIKKILLKKY